MERIFKRINGMLRVAEKKEQSHNYIDQISGRLLARNLKMVTRIIKEEIPCCQECEYSYMYELQMVCGLHDRRTEPCGYCHRGERK